MARMTDLGRRRTVEQASGSALGPTRVAPGGLTPRISAPSYGVFANRESARISVAQEKQPSPAMLNRRLPRPNNRRATRPKPLRPVHRHDIGRTRAPDRTRSTIELLPPLLGGDGP